MSTIATMPDIADDDARSVAASEKSVEPAVVEKLTSVAYELISLQSNVRHAHEKLQNVLAFASNFEEGSKSYPARKIQCYTAALEKAKQAEKAFVAEQEAKQEVKKAKKRAREQEKREEKELLDFLRPEEKALITQDIKRIMKNAASNLRMLTSNNPNFSAEDRMKTINANRETVLTKPLELPPPKKTKKESKIGLDSDDEANPKPEADEPPAEPTPPALSPQLTVPAAA